MTLTDSDLGTVSEQGKKRRKRKKGCHQKIEEGKKIRMESTETNREITCEVTEKEKGSDSDSEQNPRARGGKSKVSSFGSYKNGTKLGNSPKIQTASEDDRSSTSSRGIEDYEVLEHDISRDDEGFILVGKNRKLSPGLVKEPGVVKRAVSYSNNNEQLVRFYLLGKNRPNPIMVEKELRIALGRERIAISSDRYSISVEYNNEEEHETLCRIRTLGECEVRVRSQLNGTEDEEKVVIRGVPVSLGMEPIIETSGCKAAYRIMRSENGNKSATTSVILTFEKGKVPNEIRISYLIFRPKPYIKPAVRCFNCCLYGHIAKHCHRNPKCMNCSGPHSTRDCTSPLNPSRKCASCGSTSHPTGSKDCPPKIRANTISKTMVTQGITYAQAAKKHDNQLPNTLKISSRPELPPLYLKSGTENHPHVRAEENQTRIDQTDKISRATEKALDEKITILGDQIKELARMLESSIQNLWFMANFAVKQTKVFEGTEKHKDAKYYKAVEAMIGEEIRWLDDFYKPLKGRILNPDTQEGVEESSGEEQTESEEDKTESEEEIRGIQCKGHPNQHKIIHKWVKQHQPDGL